MYSLFKVSEIQIVFFDKIINNDINEIFSNKQISKLKELESNEDNLDELIEDLLYD